jgi:hypothetical protein
MHKPLFPTFRQPAYDLPSRPSTTSGIKLLKFSGPKLENPDSLPKTSVTPLKSSLKDPKLARPTSSSGCQVDFQEEYQKQLEKEILTEPRMHFLQVNDLDPAFFPGQTPDGFLKFPPASQKFLTIEELSLSEPIQQFKVPKDQKISKVFDEKSKNSEKSNKSLKIEEKTEEKLETQEFYRKIAEEKLKLIEEETAKLEEDMKMQNDQLDRLDVNFRENAERDRREVAARFIEKITSEQISSDPDDRVSSVLAKNQILYERIQRAFTPRVEIPTIHEDYDLNARGEPWEARQAALVNQRPENMKRSSNIAGNPVINKRLAAAMSTAASAIQASRGTIKPTVLKKPRK